MTEEQITTYRRTKKWLNVFILILFSKLLMLVLLVVSPTYKIEFWNSILAYIIPSILLSAIIIYQIAASILKKNSELNSARLLFIKWGLFSFSYFICTFSYLITSNILFFFVATVVMLSFCFRYKDVEKLS
ncbi:MAG: hypothetical protein ACK40G_17765 [Cytophagaceae bacterium]